jgi:hypothetical protein
MRNIRLTHIFFLGALLTIYAIASCVILKAPLRVLSRARSSQRASL